jgi:signal transduction histidine kinase
MSFRLRLIVAFVLISLLQAGLFTALSDQLLRDGIDGEAAARLELVARLLPRRAPGRDWPVARVAERDVAAWREALAVFSRSYGLSRATLLLPDQVLDSVTPVPPLSTLADWAASDGLQLPQLRGLARVSGPLFQAEDGWHKVLYARLDRQAEAWLRLEAGTTFLERVAALQRRLLRLSAFLGLPALFLGLGLGWLFSRRVRALERRLDTPEDGVLLRGRDEFARVSAKVQQLLDRLASERARAAALAQSRLRLAHDLSRGVAHELRNPLASLSLLVDVLLRRRREGADETELAELGDRLQAELDRLESTVARFMEFARRPELKPQVVDLAALAAKSAAGLRPLPTIEGTATALADPQAVALVLGVLLGNAVEAAGAAGRVSVRLSKRPGQAVVQIWDSGAPVGEEALGKLFTPFFTTKPKGLGLGLATAASLADQMGGALSLLADAKTFQLLLPSSES